MTQTGGIFLKSVTVSHNNIHSISFLEGNHTKNPTENLDAYLKGAIVGKNSTQTTVAFSNDREATFPNSKIVGDVGDEVFFQVIEQAPGKVQLKQEYPAFLGKLQQQRQQAVLHLFGAEKSNHQGEKIDIFEEKIKETQALNKLKRDFQYRKNVLGSSIVNQLVACGMDLEKIDLSFFRTAAQTLETTKTSAVTEEDAITLANGYIEQHPSSGTTSNTFDIAKALAQKGLPLTSGNVATIQHALTQWEDLATLPPEKFMPLLTQEKPLTLENMAMYKHVPAPQPLAFSPIDLEGMQPSIEKALVQNHIPVNAQTQEMAENFILRSIAITKENYEKYQWLTNLERTFSKEDLITASLDCIQKDCSPTTIDLFEFHNFSTLFEKNQKIQAQIDTIDLPCIQSCLNHSTLNLQGLLLHQNTPPPQQIRNEAIQAQKQLLEIQLKLTTEASYQLAHKNIAIDTLPLQKVLTELNQLSADAYDHYFQLFEDKPTPQQIQLATQVQDCVQGFSGTKQSIDWSFLKKDAPVTLQTLNQSTIATTLSAYETAQTTIRLRYGDSFQLIEDQVPEFLANLGLDNTTENTQAVALLSQQQMDVTKADVVKVRLLQEKMDKLKQHLHPVVIAKMIAEGNNPLQMPVDEILDNIEDFRKQYGTTTEEQILQALSKVKEDAALPAPVYEKMMSFYKMIYTIEKNSTFAFGQTVKNDLPMTLAQLFEAAQYQQKTRGKDFYIDNAVTDTTGLLEKTDFSAQHPILSQDADWVELHKLYFEKIAIQLTPPILQQMLKRQVGVSATPLAELKNTVTDINQTTPLDDIEGTSSKLDNFIDMFSISDVPLPILQWMETNRIQTTLTNTRLVQKMLQNENLLSDLLNEQGNFGTGLDMQNLWGNLDKIEQALGRVSPENQKNLQQLTALQKKLNTTHPNLFSVPIQQGDRFTNLNLWVVNKDFMEKKEKNMLLSLKTDHLGVVQCWVKQSQEQTHIQITTENKRISDFLQEQATSFPELAGVSLSFTERTGAETPFLTRRDGFETTTIA